MRKASLVPTAVIMMAGCLLGYLAAVSESPQSLQAATPQVRTSSDNTLPNSVTTAADENITAAPCCSEGLSRVDQVALLDTSAVATAVVAQAGQADAAKKPNILVIF